MKNYLIIGGSSGIGKELTLLLASEGHTVFASYNTNLPEQTPEGVQYFHLNVLDETVSLPVLPDMLDGFIYMPGSITLKPVSGFHPADFLNDYSLQVVGAVRVLQQILPKLKKSAGSSLLFFSTVAVQTGFPYHSVVSASKGAIEGLTRALAAELAPAIRVNAIAPSVTDTPLASFLLRTPEKRSASEQRHPLKKNGTALEQAQLAAFLLSEKAGFITGQVLAADGGISTLRV